MRDASEGLSEGTLVKRFFDWNRALFHSYAQTRHHPFGINAIGTIRRFLENGGKQHEYFSHGRPAEIIFSADRAISPDNLQESKDRPRKALSV
jgi:hypothetical protein